MNGKIFGFATLLTLFIGIIVALTLLQPAASNVAITNTIYTATNKTFAAPANGASVDLTGQSLLSTPVVTNATNGVRIASGNYTIAESISPSTGLKTVRYTTVGTNFQSVNVNITYQYGAPGYMDDAGSRSISGIIILLAALAIAVIIVRKVMEEGKEVFDY